MFESNYNYVPNPYPPAPAPAPAPGQWYPPHPQPMPGPGPMPPVYIDPSLSIPGAAADASVVGTLIASKVDLSSLSGNIQLIDGKIELLGMAEAQVGQVLSKGEDGSATWISVPTSEDIETIQSQINEINSDITEINSDISQLFETNSAQTEAIADLTQKVTTNNSRVDQIENQLTTIQHDIEELAESKLDTETFNNFLEQYSNLVEHVEELQADLGALEAAVAELQSCCRAVQTVLGDVNNYEQPLYQTLQDFETHAQAINRDFDGGDLDDEIQGIEVPDVVGKNAAVASLLLGQAGFFADQSYMGGSYPADAVVDSQNPAAGSLTPEGSIVELELQK